MNQSSQTDHTPAKQPDTDTKQDSPDYSLELIDYIQFSLLLHIESNESTLAHLFKLLAEALETSAPHIDPENSHSLKHCQANIQQLVFLMPQTLQVFGVLDD